MNHDDRDALLEVINEEVFDDFLTSVYGHEARQTVNIPEDSFTLAELQYLVDACIDAHNRSRGDGEIFESIMYYRLIHKLIALDAELERLHNEAQQKPQDPMELLFDGL